MTEQENTRRITSVEARIEAIDRLGTRGMEGVRAQFGQMQRDMGKLESSLERVENVVQNIQLQLVTLKPRSPWPAFLAYTGLIIPMYALVIDLIVSGLR